MAEKFNVDAIMKLVERHLIHETDELALAIMENFLIYAPIDTAHFKRNFQLAIGTPLLNEIPGVDMAGTATYNNAQSVLRAASRRNPYLPVFITDNVPYANRLADGWSSQAPEGWVEDQVIEPAIETRFNAPLETSLFG